jgi:translocation and assembly module TamB
LREISIGRVSFAGEGTSVSVEGRLARDDESAQGLAVNGEINLRFLSSFTDALFATGVARVQASVVGSLESPRLLGTANLMEIGVRVLDFPISLTRGNGVIRFTADQALLEDFTGTTPGGGNISVRGGAALAGLAPDRWRVEVQADQVGVEFPRDTQTVIEATLALQGNRRLQVLSGDVEVRRAAYTRDVTIEELVTGGGPFGQGFLETGPAGGGEGGLPTTLDINVRADNTLIVRNNIADAIGSAFLNIRGPVQNPIISGRVALSRGTIEFRNGRHELTRAIITLPPKRGADPVIDIHTEADIGGHRVLADFTGPLNKLQTSLRSEPELPEGDIISLILTGSVAGDERTQAAAGQTGLGLAQSLLAAGILEQFERGTQRLFGLSRFTIDPLIVGRGTDPTARITLGQRVTKNLTLTYAQNLTSSGPSGIDRIVLVEYRLSNRFSVVGFRNDRSEFGFDIRVMKRF